ncbi:hypothetical protein PC119_g5308 [Phytophthora cactorum]|nr:hypothetical protein PC119_g5308 [Phytophthora cactorum]
MQHVGDAPGDSSVQVAMAVDVQGVPQETMKINVQGVANEKVEPEVQDSGQPDEQEMLSVDDGLDNIQGGGHENPNLASLGSCFSTLKWISSVDFSTSVSREFHVTRKPSLEEKLKATPLVSAQMEFL